MKIFIAKTFACFVICFLIPTIESKQTTSIGNATDMTIHVTSFSVFYTDTTVSIGLKHVLRMVTSILFIWEDLETRKEF